MIEQDLITGVRFMGAASMLVISLVIALVNRGRVCSSVYEHSRWLICAATLLLGIHNIIQFLGHYREESNTLCWTINLAFYVLITPLYNAAELNLLRAGSNMKVRYWRNFLFTLVCLTIFAIGYFTDTIINDEKPWKTATFAVAVCYFLNIVELSRMLLHDMKVVGTRLADEDLEDRHQALRYTATSMHWVIIFSLATPWVGMSTSLVLNSLFGLVMFCLLLWFIIQFVMYGNNMAELIEVTDEITEAVMIEEESQHQHEILQDSFATAQQRIEQWVSRRNFTNPNVTISSALKEMNISAIALNFYLEHNTSVENYRKWLPYLRIEEAKRIMLEHPEYSLDAVASECGYANKSSLSHAFKTQVGMTPAAWASAQRTKI